MIKNLFLLYVDGACSNNGLTTSRAGSAAIIHFINPINNTLSARSISTYLGVGLTNQVAEIKAAELGLYYIIPQAKDSLVVVFTDSTYVVNTMRCLWTRKANQKHWASLDAVVANYSNNPIWVHLREEKDGGHKNINKVDALAKAAVQNEKGIDQIHVGSFEEEINMFALVWGCVPLSVLDNDLTLTLATKIGEDIRMALDKNKRLEDLRDQRRKLDEEIGGIEKAEKNKRKATTLERDYVKVVCPSCEGRAASSRMGSDNSDVFEIDCDSCQSRGYLYGRKFDGVRSYDMEFNEVQTS